MRTVEANNFFVVVSKVIRVVDVQSNIISSRRSQEMFEGTLSSAYIDNLFPRETRQELLHVPVDRIELEVNSQAYAVNNLVKKRVGGSMCRRLKSFVHSSFLCRKS